MIELLNEALSAKNIVGMTVMRSYQPTDINGKNLILINKISSRRYGWRGRHNKLINNIMTHIEKYFQEMRFQISVLKKINISDASEITAADIANKIVDYFLSDKGLKSLRNKGYMPLRVVDVRDTNFVNENENYQFNPNFDLICTIEQEIVENQDVLDGYDFTLKGV